MAEISASAGRGIAELFVAGRERKAAGRVRRAPCGGGSQTRGTTVSATRGKRKVLVEIKHDTTQWYVVGLTHASQRCVRIVENEVNE